jgi:hypothetical protein
MSTVATTGVRTDERRLLGETGADGRAATLAEHRSRYRPAPVPARRP